MKAYKGAPKRWIEGFYGGSYPPNEDAVEVRNPFFRRFYGRDALLVPNVGFRLVGGAPSARPLIVATDLQPGSFDAALWQATQATRAVYMALGVGCTPWPPMPA